MIYEVLSNPNHPMTLCFLLQARCKRWQDNTALPPVLPLLYKHGETGQKRASQPSLMLSGPTCLEQPSHNLGQAFFISVLYGNIYRSRVWFLSTCI